MVFMDVQPPAECAPAATRNRAPALHFLDRGPQSSRRRSLLQRPEARPGLCRRGCVLREKAASRSPQPSAAFLLASCSLETRDRVHNKSPTLLACLLRVAASGVPSRG